MAKNLKLQIKNTQIAGAINLRGLKEKLSKKKASESDVEDTALLTQNEDAKEASKSKAPKKAKEQPEKAAELVETKQEKLPPVKETPQVLEVQAPVQTPKVESAAPVSKPEPIATPPIEASEKMREPIKAEEKPAFTKPRESYPPRQPSQMHDVPRSQWKPRPQGSEGHGTGQPYQQRPSQGYERRPHQGDGQRPPYREGQRPPYQGDGQRPPYQGDGQRPPYQGDGQRPPYRGDGQRPPYQGDGQRPPYQGDGQRPPYRDGPRNYGAGGQRPYTPGSGPGGGQRPYNSGSNYGGGQRPPYSPGQGRPQGPSGFKPFTTAAARPFAPQGPRPQNLPPKMGDETERKRKEQKEPTAAQLEAQRRARQKAKEDSERAGLRKSDAKTFDARHRHGLKGGEEEEGVWRKRRPKYPKMIQEQEIVRPSKISVRLPILIKDLAQEMKIKASEVIAKLFLQGIVVTLNDFLSDETVVQLIGNDFGCEILIDTTEEERIRVTDKTIKEEIESLKESCILRPPVVTFMGHVDHGKTSLIDAIRKSNRVQYEVGAITQHIGAFTCQTSHGLITILDTPGHSAFAQMRERGAEITDIVVLVVAGDDGMKEQTYEALKAAQGSNATIVVAINKCDKPGFDPETVYRQLSEVNLLPESWGGQTITVNCSAVTGDGINSLLEMLALQAEVLELRASLSYRARGTVIESQMHKGLGPVATILIQNGTLHVGDSLVFASNWGRVKTMRDENGKDIKEATPSQPVMINGISGFPESGEEFIVVKSEKEAKEIAEKRTEGRREVSYGLKKRITLDSMIESAKTGIIKKVLNLILCADVKGSLEALKTAIEKIDSNKVDIAIISTCVGEVSESDVQLAHASKATILRFHAPIEMHAEQLAKELGVVIKSHNIIYHAIDDIRDVMRSLLDKIAQDKDIGKAEVKALFKSSHLGVIAGCQVIDGTITRNSSVRQVRDGNIIWKGPISSLKRVKEDVREVQKGVECGIILQGSPEVQVGDMFEAYETIYLAQEL